MNNKKMANVILLSAADNVVVACEQINAGLPITFFEITTCAALVAFASQPADVVLLETGLGGRLDATNVIRQPAVTVLTPISLDHQQFLGDTLAQIGREKAGILTELRRREYYEKPTQERKRKKAAAVKRQLKRTSRDSNRRLRLY